MPEDAPVISAVSATERTLNLIFRGRVAGVVPGRVRTSEHDHAYRDARGTGSLLGIRVPLGARDAFVSGPEARAGGGQPGADAVSAGPRPDRPLEGVSSAEAQDAGLRGAGGRSLPDEADPHARGLLHLADGGAGARLERGPDGGD